MNCINCNTELTKRQIQKKGKFCDRDCLYKWQSKHPNNGTIKKGQRLSKDTEFKPGNKRPQTWTDIQKEKCTGDKSVLWKGGKNKRPDGYVLIYKPEHPLAVNKYVMEHRLTMEEKIGRYLLQKEIVHHINGDRGDNKIDNLELIESTGKHSIKYHIDRCPSTGRFLSKK